MNKITAEVSEKLMYIASKLPTVMEGSVEYHFISLDEAKEMYPDIELKAIPAGPLKGKVRVPMPVSIAQNHYRRLRKRYMKHGEPGVVDYIKSVQSLKSEC